MAVKTLLSSSKSGHIVMHQVTKTERCRNEATKLEATPGGDSEQKKPCEGYIDSLHHLVVQIGTT